jgi:lipopolysaccharide/colanic/teichoic acid biosynthesis glycosyltransferase
VYAHTTYTLKFMFCAFCVRFFDVVALLVVIVIFVVVFVVVAAVVRTLWCIWWVMAAGSLLYTRIQI